MGLIREEMEQLLEWRTERVFGSLAEALRFLNKHKDSHFVEFSLTFGYSKPDYSPRWVLHYTME